MPTGSKPGFSQKSWSSIAVVASSISLGIASNPTTSRFSEPRRASSTLPVRSYTIGLLVELELGEDRLRVGQTLGVVVVHAHGEDSSPTKPVVNAKTMKTRGMAMAMRRTVREPPRAWGRREIDRRWRWRRARLVCMSVPHDSIGGVSTTGWSPPGWVKTARRPSL